MMNTMMTETLLTGTARKGELPGWQAAGKTGTSQDYRDAWFIGYTSRLTTGIWLGNDDSSPTKKASGGSLPVEIWSRFMKVAMAGQPPTPLPGGTIHGAPVAAPMAAAANASLPNSLFGIPLPDLGGRDASVAAIVPRPAGRTPTTSRAGSAILCPAPPVRRARRPAAGRGAATLRPRA